MGDPGVLERTSWAMGLILPWECEPRAVTVPTGGLACISGKDSTQWSAPGRRAGPRLHHTGAVSRTDEYAAALDQLASMQSSGLISQGNYDVKRARLIAEASNPGRSLATSFLIFVAVILAISILVPIVVAITG